jgi:hypothetical protein
MTKPNCCQKCGKRTKDLIENNWLIRDGGDYVYYCRDCSKIWQEICINLTNHADKTVRSALRKFMGKPRIVFIFR